MAIIESDVPITFSLVGIGKYCDKIIAQMVLQDPGYFLWANRHGVFKDELWFQALILKSRLSRLLPPRNQPELFEFVLITQGKYFKAIEIVKKGEMVAGVTARSKGRYKRKRTPYLDVPGLIERVKNKKYTCMLLKQFIKAKWLGGTEMTLSRENCERFFNNLDNFDPSWQSLAKSYCEEHANYDESEDYKKQRPKVSLGQIPPNMPTLFH